MDTPGVSIVTCTHQPGSFMNILNNYRRQRYKRKELIIILNKDSLDVNEWRRKAARYPRVKVYQIPEKVSLGQCLNGGISQSRYPLIAKFDHDDYYSPYYLREQVKTLRRTNCHVIGKHACLVYLKARQQLIIRSSREQNKFVRFVQGGTLLFRRHILKHVRFSDRTLGEDVKFLRDCRNKGYTIYATSPYNYVYIRRRNKSTHTWKVGDHKFLQGSHPVAVTTNYRRLSLLKA